MREMEPGHSRGMFRIRTPFSCTSNNRMELGQWQGLGQGPL